MATKKTATETKGVRVTADPNNNLYLVQWGGEVRGKFATQEEADTFAESFAKKLGEG